MSGITMMLGHLIMITLSLVIDTQYFIGIGRIGMSGITMLGHMP